MRDFGFQARHRLLKVFQLCCSLIDRPWKVHPAVTMELSGSTKFSMIVCCWYNRMFWSLDMRTNCSSQFLFWVAVREATAKANAGQVLVTPGFCLWKGFWAADYNEFVRWHMELYVNFIAERRRTCENFHIESNKPNRFIEIGRSSVRCGCW